MIELSDLIQICKKNKVKKIIKNNGLFDQMGNGEIINNESRFLYKLYLSIDEKKNKYDMDNDNDNDNDNNSIPVFLKNFLKDYSISTIDIEKEESFLKSIISLIDADFTGLSNLLQNKVINIVKKELSIKFINEKYSKELNLRKYKMLKTDVTKILLNDEPINIIIKQFISLVLELNILIANYDNNKISCIDNFKKYNGTIILLEKNNIFKPIFTSTNKNIIYNISDELLKKYDIPIYENIIKFDCKYTEKDLNKLKVSEIHLIAKNMEISIIDEENKKKLKKTLIKEIIENY